MQHSDGPLIALSCTIQDEEVLGHFEEHVLNQSPSEAMLRCIQVDLSTFGLDTYGLVYSMSNPLVDHDVNLLCISTLRTANVLVMSNGFCPLLCLDLENDNGAGVGTG